MKLEIKHLAPYLPYELKCKWNQSKPFTIVGLQNGNESVNNELWTWKDGSKFLIGYLYECKPILRPLKDLSEIIKGKGVSYTSYLWYEIISTDNDSFNKDEFYENCELGMIEFLPIIVYEQLFKWHFDVFNLIQKGLAVDINTLSVE